MQVALICLIAQPTIIAGALSLLGCMWPAAQHHHTQLPRPGGQPLVLPTALFILLPASLALAAVWATHRSSPLAVSGFGKWLASSLWVASHVFFVAAVLRSDVESRTEYA